MGAGESRSIILGNSKSSCISKTEKKKKTDFICICKPTTRIMQSEERKQKRKGKKASDAAIKQSDSSSAAAAGDNNLLTRFQLLSMDTTKNEILPKEESRLPQPNVLYYGWFFNNEVSLLIKEIAYTYMTECLENVQQFQRFMRDACQPHEISDPLTFYRRPKKLKLSEELEYHITAKFLDRKPNPEYTTMVEPFIGKIFKIHIVGLYFTQKSFGVRVKLTDAQKIMFDEREGTKDRMSASKTPLESGLNDVNNINCFQNTIQEELANYKSNSKAKNPKCKSRLHSRFAKKGVALLPLEPNDVQPPTSSRAHITIGCAPNIKAVQTGIDLLDIIDLEHRSGSSTSVFHQDYLIDGGTLRQFGLFGDAFVIYPCHEIVAEATFNVYS